MNPRVVFDSSTLVSAALRPKSIPQQALDHAFEFFDVCGSIDTLIELERVLLRKKFDGYLTPEMRVDFVAFLRSNIHLVTVSDDDLTRLNPPCRDKKDNAFLALAMAARAGTIITSDSDLLVLHPWNEIAILTPSQFVALAV